MRRANRCVDDPPNGNRFIGCRNVFSGSLPWKASPWIRDYEYTRQQPAAADDPLGGPLLNWNVSPGKRLAL